MNIIELESEEMNLACSIYLAVLYKNTMQCLKSQKVRNFFGALGRIDLSHLI